MSTDAHALGAADYDEQWSRLGDFLRYNPGARHRRRLVRRALARAGVGAGTVLDVGCGLGEMIADLTSHFPDVAFAGADLSPLAVERARAAWPQHEWLVLDITDGPLDRSFDAVICSEVLEHLERPRDAVGHLAAMLAPGGALIVTVPHGRVFPTERAVGHVRHPAIPELTAWLVDAGLEVERLRRWGWPAYAALKHAANLRPEATMEAFGSGTYSAPVRAMNSLAYAGTGLGSLPSSPWGVQTVVTARRVTS